MTVAAFVARLDALPQPAPGSEPEREVELSIAYLASPDALASLEADTYWPKWDSPWWHMVLLRERGQAAVSRARPPRRWSRRSIGCR